MESIHVTSQNQNPSRASEQSGRLCWKKNTLLVSVARSESRDDAYFFSKLTTYELVCAKFEVLQSGYVIFRGNASLTQGPSGGKWTTGKDTPRFFEIQFLHQNRVFFGEFS